MTEPEDFALVLAIVVSVLVTVAFVTGMVFGAWSCG